MQGIHVQSNFFSDSRLSRIQVRSEVQKIQFPFPCRLKIEGEVASRDQAPVVICAPHTSFLGSFTDGQNQTLSLFFYIKLVIPLDFFYG